MQVPADRSRDAIDTTHRAVSSRVEFQVWRALAFIKKLSGDQRGWEEGNRAGWLWSVVYVFEFYTTQIEAAEGDLGLLRAAMDAGKLSLSS